jgi:hypothetical protein
MRTTTAFGIARRLGIRLLGLALGGLFGGLIGLFAAPAWEMAFVVVGLAGAATGATAGALAASSSASGAVLGSVALVLGAGTMVCIARHGPLWVVVQATTAVTGAGLCAVLVGQFLGKGAPPARGASGAPRVTGE